MHRRFEICEQGSCHCPGKAMTDKTDGKVRGLSMLASQVWHEHNVNVVVPKGEVICTFSDEGTRSGIKFTGENTFVQVGGNVRMNTSVILAANAAQLVNEGQTEHVRNAELCSASFSGTRGEKRGACWLQATKDIKKDTRILTQYGPTFWEGHGECREEGGLGMHQHYEKITQGKKIKKEKVEIAMESGRNRAHLLKKLKK